MRKYEWLKCEENVYMWRLSSMTWDWAGQRVSGVAIHMKYIYTRTCEIWDWAGQGRESQERPQLYKEKFKYERKREEKKKKRNLCETCVENSGRILTCINIHCYTIFAYIHGIVILYICCWMWELCYELNVRTLVVKE